MKMTCKKYRWYDQALGENEVNFFSTSPKQLVDTIDLKYYLVENTLSEFESELEGINEVTNGLEIKMSNVSFQCKNEILGRGSLQDFFQVYEKDEKIKFTFEYKDDDNDILFSGIIYKDGVEFSERVNDILDIIAVSQEKEFIDYFSNKDLVYPAAWTWLRLGTLLGISGGTDNVNNQAVFSLIDLLQANFTGVTIGGIPSDHYIITRPYTYAPLVADHTFKDMGNLLHIRTGMDQFINDKVKRYDYFSRIFQGKGWVFFFSKGVMYIKERGQSDLDTTSIDYTREVLSHSVSSDLLDKQVDNVAVFNGGYFDNSSYNGALRFTDTTGTRRYLGGAIRSVYTIQEHSNKVRPFVNLEYSNPSSNDHRYRILNGYLDYSVHQSDSEKILRRTRIRLNGTSYGYSYSDLDLSKQRTLLIDIEDNSLDNAGGIDLNNARANSGAYYGDGNFYYAANIHSDSHIYYTGNPASSMFRYNPADGKFYTYEKDCEGENFVNNFKKFIRSANPILFDIEVKKKITDPYQNIMITNYPYANTVNNKTFSIQRLSYNDSTKISKLTLQMI